MRRVAQVAAATLLLTGSLLMTACSGEAVTLGFGPSDVEHVEVFLYTYEEDPAEVTRSVVSDRVEVAEFVQMFTDVPVQDLGDVADEIWGAPGAGVRFVLRDGSTREITQVFVAPKEVVLLWPDGVAALTERGADISLYGTPADPEANELIDADTRPRTVAP